MHRNEITGEQYKGKNVARVLVSEAEHGYNSERGWAGYGQWQSLGRQVCKGEKSTRIMVVFVGKDGNKGVGSRAIFHYDQTEPAEEDAPKSRARHPRSSHGDDVRAQDMPADVASVTASAIVREPARNARGRRTADASALLARLGSAVK